MLWGWRRFWGEPLVRGRVGNYIMRRFVYSLQYFVMEERIGVAWSTHTPTGKCNTEFIRKLLLDRTRFDGSVLQKYFIK